MNFWQTKEWFELKMKSKKTDKILSRMEYLKEFGAKNFSEEIYQEYIKLMNGRNIEINNTKTN